MQGYDILMLGVMAIAVIRGYSKGLAWQISSIAAIVVSYFVAYRFKDRLAPHIDMADPWRGLVAMMALFVGTSLAIWFIFQNIRGAIEKAKLKDFDKQLGAIFGGIKGVAWCTVITVVALTFLQPDMSQQIVHSRSGLYIARIIASSKRLIPAEVQQVVQPYIQRAEEQLQDRSEQSLEGIASEWVPDDAWYRENAPAPSVGQTPEIQPPNPAFKQPLNPPLDDSWFRQSSQTDPLGEFSNHGSDQSYR